MWLKLGESCERKGCILHLYDLTVLDAKLIYHLQRFSSIVNAKGEMETKTSEGWVVRGRWREEREREGGREGGREGERKERE